MKAHLYVNGSNSPYFFDYGEQLNDSSHQYKDRNNGIKHIYVSSFKEFKDIIEDKGVPELVFFDILSSVKINNACSTWLHFYCLRKRVKRPLMKILGVDGTSKLQIQTDKRKF